MQRSTDRILTTHCGSLARPRPLLELMRDKERGRPYDQAAFAAAVTEAVSGTVHTQAERERVIAGTDCGFSSRASFAPEIPDSIVWEKFRALVEGARIADSETHG